jgi:hypothetical protein
MSIGGQLQIGGVRPDGVVLVGVGDHQMVLLNVVEGFRTRVLDELVINQYGPWRPIRASKDLRERVKHLMAQNGAIVSPETVGTDDRQEVELDGRPQPTRQDFVEMLETANLAVGDVFPTEEQSMVEEPDFLNTCLSTIVPQMVASGLAVDDPSSFCALMHMERTGLMPRAGDAPAADVPPPAAEDTAQATDPAAPEVPVRPAVEDPQQFSEVPPEAPAAPELATPPPAGEIDAAKMPNDFEIVKVKEPDELTKSCIGKPYKKKKEMEADGAGKPGAV